MAQNLNNTRGLFVFVNNFKGGNKDMANKMWGRVLAIGTLVGGLSLVLPSIGFNLLSLFGDFSSFVQLIAGILAVIYVWQNKFN